MAPERETTTFRAMGTDVVLTAVDAPDGALARAADLVHTCERRWSRFLDTSELAQLNRRAGRPVVLPRDTYELVRAAVRCWSLTAGWFDPTVLRAIESAGYDRSFDQASRAARPTRATAGCAAIGLDDALGAVTLPTGVCLDLGGIAKGHTADLVVELLVEEGASGAVADLGGDVRVGGEPPEDGWPVAIADPFDTDVDLRIVHLASGAVATSSTTRRRWRHGTRELHHLIDPFTGAPSASSLAAVTVVAATAAWAEVVAKAALLADDDAACLVHAAGATGLAVTTAGELVVFDGLEAYT